MAPSLEIGEKRAAETEESKKKIKKPKTSFIYGNYRNYYGYRIDRDQSEDPRLTVFRKEWFEGKDCLDIGCNQGLITIAIAKKFLCQSILGIDIDAGLIEAAHWNLRKFARTMKASKSQVSDGTDCSEHKGCQGSNEEGTDCSEHKVCQDSNEETQKNISSPGEDDIFRRVSFKKENFVESWNGCFEKYDAILCLSVSKWIHLNWGDEGLITLFVKIWRLLRPGGVFVLEPQPWSSYRKNRRVSKTATVNFDNILLQPHVFRDILLDKIGFRSAEIVSDSLAGTVAGFDRPIIAFTK